MTARTTAPSTTPADPAAGPASLPGQGPLSSLSALHTTRPDGGQARVRLAPPAGGRGLGRLKAPMLEGTRQPAPAAAGPAEPLPDLAALYQLVRPEIPDILEPVRDAQPEPPPMRGRPLAKDEQRLIADWAEQVDGALPGMTGEAFERKLAELVSMMACDQDLLAACMAHIREGLSGRWERAMLSWQQVQVELLTHEAARGRHSPESLFQLGRRMYRLERVDSYARQSAPRLLFRHGLSTAMLTCREDLREPLQLPIPAVRTLGTAAAGGSAFSDRALDALRKEILASESAQGGQALNAFLAGWPPMTAFLAAGAPELAGLHRSIDQYGEVLRGRIEAHAQGASSSSAEPRPLLGAAQCKARLEQAGREITGLHHAANLAAVQGRYLHRAEDLESDLQQVAAMRSGEAARRFVGRLHAALAERTLDPAWTHPTQGWNHLHVAAAAGDAGLARALVNAGVRPHVADDSGMTPLHVAAANGHAEPAAVFITTGADVNALAATGFSPLQFAAGSGSRTCVKALLRGGADIDQQDPAYGMSALHFAATQGQLEALQELVEAGADPLLQTHAGGTALDTLESSEKALAAPGYKEARALLKEAEHMARILSRAQ
jgi:hypothetical protein